MAALGLWLWSNPRAFGTANSCAIDSASTVILGNRVRLRSSTLRAWSIAIYSLFLAPGFNLILPMGLFLGMIIWAHRGGQNRDNEAPYLKLGAPQSTSGSEVPTRGAPILSRAAWNAWYTRLRSSPGILAIFAGLFILFVINIIFMLDIELTLRQNRHLQDAGDSESVWTFGQILAMILLVLPLRDVLRTLLARYAQQREEEHILFLIHSRKVAWENIIQGKVSPKTIQDLFKNGVDVNQKIGGRSFRGMDSIDSNFTQIPSLKPDFRWRHAGRIRSWLAFF